MPSVLHAFLAQTAEPQQGLGNMLIPLVLMGAVFYFLLIRPQQKKQKEHQALVAALKTGDKVVTSAGIHGLIANVKESTVLVKVADNVKIEMDKAAVATVLKPSDNS